LAFVEVESFVAADRGVAQFLYINKIAFEFEDVLLLHFELFHCVEPSAVFVLAAIDAAIAPLPQFFEKLIFLYESVISLEIKVS